MKTRHAMRMWSATATALNLAALMACSGGGEATRPISGGGETTRPMHLTGRISFTHKLKARRPETSNRRILHQGDTVENGDEIQALVTPTEAVYLYLGYCDGHDFAMFPLPPQSNLRAEAGRETRIPPGDVGLTISGDSKSEVLYLIVSKGELSRASPDLAVQIARSGSSIDGDCADPRRDKSGLTISPNEPIDVRSSDGAIAVVRYDFKHQASTKATER